ncbi:MAG: hypothetical protein H0X59_07720 [Chloroflexi bacterium]|nr:hypothetical protein [Chloroflexota bacterium]
MRRNRGTEIGAACGQLAAELAAQPTPAAVARRREILVERSAAALRDAPAHARATAVPDAAAAVISR